MVAEHVERLTGGLQCLGGGERRADHEGLAFGGRTRADEQQLGVDRLHDRLEGGKVTGEVCCVVVGRHADRERGLVEHLGGHDRDLVVDAELQQRSGLVGVPVPLGVAGSRAGRERRDDLCADGIGELADASPLICGEHGVEAGRRRTAGGPGSVEVGGVRPRAAHPDVSGSEALGEVPQALGRHVERRPGDLAGSCVVGLPELAAGDLDHLDVVRLVAGIELSGRLLRCRQHHIRLRRVGSGRAGGGGRGGRSIRLVVAAGARNEQGDGQTDRCAGKESSREEAWVHGRHLRRCDR